MNKRENEPKANKPTREKDNIKKNDLPYDPEINEDDRQILQEKGHSMAPNEDRDKFLADRERPVDFAADDLDIPGRNESDTTHDGTDLPDEENFQYNQRGKRPDEAKKGEHPNPNREVPKRD